MQLKNIVSVCSHITSTYVLYRYLLFSFQFQRLLEEAAVEKERLVTELQYVCYILSLDISDGVHE